MEKRGNMNRVFLIMMVFMAISLGIAFLWDSLPVIKNFVNSILNPTFGALIDWNLTLGMLIVVFLMGLLTTFAQKYTTDQKTLRELKKEQKEVQKEMQKYRQDPKKMLEIQKSLMPTTFKIMELSMRGSIFTIIPFILLFRWFMDFFSTKGNPSFFGFMSWFWFYLIFTIIFSSFLRKFFKVA
jgi:uncharacterized membrane protein (DUF106 family)